MIPSSACRCPSAQNYNIVTSIIYHFLFFCNRDFSFWRFFRRNDIAFFQKSEYNDKKESLIGGTDEGIDQFAATK